MQATCVVAEIVEPSFEDVLRLHERSVFGLIFHMVRNAAIAEELAQDIFLEFHRVMRKMHSPEHTRAWLRRTAVHRAMDVLRRRSYACEVPLEEEWHPAQDGEQADLLELETLRRLVALLPAPQRAVVVLRYMEDLQPSEISECLGVPVNTVKSRLSRGLASLRERLVFHSGKNK